MSVRIKILLSMIIVGLLVAVPAGMLFGVLARDLIYRNEVNAKASDVRKMAVMTADSLEADDYVPIIHYIGRMKKLDRALEEIAVADRNGQIVAHMDPGLIGKPYPAHSGGTLRWETEIRSTLRDEPLGRLYVRYDRAAIENDIGGELRAVEARVALITASAFLVAILPGLWLAHGIARPLRRLAAACRTVGSGNLEIDLENRGRDEVAVVTGEVKKMVGKLREIDALKDDFVNNVSHELRSPLASIKSYGEILQSGSFGALTAKQLEFIEIIKKAAVRLSTFVNNMLDVAKIKAGKFELESREADMFALVSEVVQMHQPQFIEKAVRCDIPGRAGRALLVCDAEGIKRVITNLVNNGLKFTPERGTITVTVVDEGSSFRCEVRDTGPGIRPEELGMLFKRFEQTGGPAGKGQRRKGTGLGLSISRDIVELHGGAIWAESGGPGRGSVFCFRLPKTAKPRGTGHEENVQP